MIIKTITCHDVYNVGASLQAYALQYFLTEQGHEIEIINYKPDYLSKHYKLTVINNPRFDRPLFKQLYILAKLPGRIAALFDRRKKNFDEFRKNKLSLTKKKYSSNEELKNSPPDADIYIAGSDQIWNPLFKNGKDPAFFLDFVPKGKKRISYAASFATTQISSDDMSRMTFLLKKFDAVSVREKCSLNILEKMGIENAVSVCDPVFLMSKQFWESKARGFSDKAKYLFVYDFDNLSTMNEVTLKLARENDLKIYSFFKNSVADEVLNELGPLEFLDVIKNAEVVVSNSFHATAFSIIFHTDFYVMNRKENINIRMNDLLANLGLEKRMIVGMNDLDRQETIEWNNVDEKLHKIIVNSKEYLDFVCK